MKRIYFLLFIAACSTLFVETVFSLEQSEELLIESIKSTGNVSIAESEILSQVRSRVNDIFDADIAAEDAKRIARIDGVEYSYYSVTVVENKIQLIFVVVEKNLVRSISFTGNKKFKTGKLQKKLDFKIADYLDPVQVQVGREKIVDYYHKNGYPFVEVELNNEVLRTGNVAYTIVEGPRSKIKSISFQGNEALKTNSLKKVVKTSPKQFLIIPKYYNQENMSKYLTKLQNVYYENGFLDVKITEEKEFNETKSKVKIVFLIKEGKAYAVDNITISGNEYFDSQKLHEELKLTQGKIYNENKAKSDTRILLKNYRESGFIEAEVEKNIKFISADKVDVDFKITENERFKINQIDITGNEQTQDKVIRRVLDEYDFKPGQWYNADIAHGDGSGKLEETTQQMTYSKSVIITPSDNKPGFKDAKVNVTEGQTGSIMMGVGLSSDSGAMGQAIFQQRNFDIKDKPKSFKEFISGKAFKGAGQTMRIALEPGTEFSRYSLSFTEPYFKNKPISLNYVLASTEWERECYDEGRIRSVLGFEKRYKNNWRRSVSFRVESVDVGSIDSDAPKEITEDKGSNLIAGIKLGIGKDLTDDRFNPSSGYNYEASLEQIGGDHTFAILSGTYRKYKTLYEDLAERKTILAIKLHAATIVGDAPAFEKFYAGGSQSIRGFEYRGVSPRGKPYVNGAPTGGKSKDPIGSDWIFLANTEVTIPLSSDKFAALFFIDSGAVDDGSYRVAAGVGFQILLPQWFGPVPMRFELATPLMKDGADDTQIFSFSMGKLF